MKNKNYRLELVQARLIKRMPGLRASPTAIGKARGFAKERGCCKPVVLSDSQGCLTLLCGAATYEACLNEKVAKIPAIIVHTEGEADDLLFALQSAGLDEPPDAVGVSAAIVQLVDKHNIPRKHIADALGKSPAWLNRMESLCRKLNATVQEMVAQGRVPPRTAQEISRLPDDVQVQFAVSAANEFLSKQNVAYLVNRYLNEGACAEERGRIIFTPALALPNEYKKRGRHTDNSSSARLSRAIARCMDDASYLHGLLDRIDTGEAAIRMQDVVTLAGALTGLHRKLVVVFYPGKGGGCDD